MRKRVSENAEQRCGGIYQYSRVYCAPVLVCHARFDFENRTKVIESLLVYIILLISRLELSFHLFCSIDGLISVVF